MAHRLITQSWDAGLEPLFLDWMGDRIIALTPDSKGNTLLHALVENGPIQGMKTVVQHSIQTFGMADVNVFNVEWQTPFHLLLLRIKQEKYNYTLMDLAKWMIEQGAPLNQKTLTLKKKVGQKTIQTKTVPGKSIWELLKWTSDQELRFQQEKDFLEFLNIHQQKQALNETVAEANDSSKRKKGRL